MKTAKHTRVNFGSFVAADIQQATIHRRQRDDGSSYFALELYFQVTDPTGMARKAGTAFRWEKEIPAADVRGLVTQADLDAATAALAAALGGDGLYDGEAPPVA